MSTRAEVWAKAWIKVWAKFTAALLVAAAAVCVAPSQQGSEPAPTLGPTYVALGDSAAAAPLVPYQADPRGCLKSTNDYPSVLARRIGARSFRDVTCSGATSANVIHRAQQTRGEAVPPQIDAVGAGTELITITIGGNDIGLAGSASKCRRNSLSLPPCFDGFTAAGQDRFSAAIDRQIPVWEAMVDAVRAKAPDARIVLVGYGTYIRSGGCFGRQPINPRDADFFQAKVDELNDAQRALAARKQVEFFDTRPLSVGHDMCATVEERYFEGFVLSHEAAPLHPNAMGAAAVADALARQLVTANT